MQREFSLKWFFIVFAVMFCLQALIGSATVRYMAPAGTSGVTPTSPYDTTAKATFLINDIDDASSSGDVIMLLSGTYSVTANATISTDGLTLAAYKTTPDTDDPFKNDISVGGALYKTDYAVLNNEVSGDTINCTDALGELKLLNIKFTGQSITEQAVDCETTWTAQGYAHLWHNVWVDGGFRNRVANISNFAAIDCKFTGTWGTGATTVRGCLDDMTSGIVYNCYFQLTAGDGCVDTQEGGKNSEKPCVIIAHNILTLDETGTLENDFIRIGHGGYAFNNIFYEPAGASVGSIGDDDAAIKIVSTDTRHWMIWNNIFYSEKVSNPMYAVFIEDITENLYNDYNCLFGITTDAEYRGGTNDIAVNPGFVDAANYDFRLKPDSPCLNTGQRVISKDATTDRGAMSMGAWQSWSSPIPNRGRNRYSGDSINN